MAQEVSCETMFDFSFEDEQMDKAKLQEFMLDEVYKARPSEKAKREAEKAKH